MIMHISALRKTLDRRMPVDITLWTRSGEVQRWRNCVSLRHDFYAGTRLMKLLDSHQLRRVRDVCIFRCNNEEVYL